MKNQVKKIASIISICVISYTSTSHGQNVNIDMARESNLMTKNVSAKIIADGSPYIEENMQPIRIDQYEGQIYQGRYNAYNGEMEVKLTENQIIALDVNAQIKVSFTNKNKTYETQTYLTENGGSKRGFLVVLLSNENYSLYKEERIKYYRKEEGASSYQPDKPATFRRESDNYFIKVKDVVTFLPQKKRDFLKAFPKHASKLKSYMKENKLNPKDEDELVKLIDYLETL